MKNKKMTVFLVVIIIIQLAVPVTMLINYQKKMKEFNANYKEINVYIDGVYCYENSFGIYSNGLNSYDSSKSYVVFSEVEPGFYRWERTDKKPENKIYVDLNEKVNDFGYLDYRKNDMPEGYDFYGMDYVNLYDKAQERENIEKNYCNGPETKAYMVLKVYNGLFEIKEVYINSIPLDEYYYMAQNGEADVERFDYIYNYGYDYETEYYEYYDEELGEYISEPYVA